MKSTAHLLCLKRWAIQPRVPSRTDISDLQKKRSAMNEAEVGETGRKAPHRETGKKRTEVEGRLWGKKYVIHYKNLSMCWGKMRILD